jgi:hypothetical protein
VGGPGDQCTGFEFGMRLPHQQLTKRLRGGYATLRAAALGFGTFPLPAPAPEDPSEKEPPHGPEYQTDRDPKTAALSPTQKKSDVGKKKKEKEKRPQGKRAYSPS